MLNTLIPKQYTPLWYLVKFMEGWCELGQLFDMFEGKQMVLVDAC